MKRITIFLTIFALTVILLMSTINSTNPKTEYTESFIDKIYTNTLASTDLAIALNRINSIMEFFEKNSARINVDGLFGLRIAQGVFNKYAKNEGKTTKLDQAINYKLKLAINLLNKRLVSLANKVTGLVQAQTPDYYDQFQLLINRPYVIDDKRVSLDQISAYNSTGLNIRFNERFSDACLDLLMKNLENSDLNCATDSQCFDYFLQENASEYFLTHQLLYFIVADHIGCSGKVLPDLVKHLKKRNLHVFDAKNEFDKNRVFAYYCGKIFGEASELYEDILRGKSFQQDLLIEQNVLCGMLGIEEFYDKKFFDLTGSFQLLTGCFGAEITEFNGLDVEANFDEVLNEIYLSNEVQSQIDATNLAQGSRRFKRVDMKMGNGCSSHETGLAIAYFSLYFNQVLNNLENIE